MGEGIHACPRMPLLPPGGDPCVRTPRGSTDSVFLMESPPGVDPLLPFYMHSLTFR